MFTIISEQKAAWRQTTTDYFKCKTCSCNLKGINGYFITGEYYWKDKICCECYKKYRTNLIKKLEQNINQLKNLQPSDLDKVKRFNKLTKTRILKKLSKSK